MENEFPPDCRERFAPLQPIAAGGFARVWLARQIGLDREVAIKVLSAHANEEAALRFEKEARLTATLSHPGVVVLLDAGAAAGAPWIAYEYVSGPDLGVRLRAGPLPWDEVLAVGQQVADALAAAHALGIVHRDIKPANILQPAPLRYKLADFGLAFELAPDEAPLTQRGVMVGTALYLAPELVRGARPSPASDLYALGATLFELATGAPPFAGEALAVLEAHLKAEPPRASAVRAGLPPAADALFAGLLAKAPGDRPASAEALARELRALEPPPATEPTPRGLRVVRESGSTSRAAGRDATSATRAIGREATSSTRAPPPASPVDASRILKMIVAGAVALVVALLVRASPRPAPPAPSPSSAPSASGAPEVFTALTARYELLARRADDRNQRGAQVAPAIAAMRTKLDSGEELSEFCAKLDDEAEHSIRDLLALDEQVRAAEGPVPEATALALRACIAQYVLQATVQHDDLRALRHTDLLIGLPMNDSDAQAVATRPYSPEMMPRLRASFARMTEMLDHFAVAPDDFDSQGAEALAVLYWLGRLAGEVSEHAPRDGMAGALGPFRRRLASPPGDPYAPIAVAARSCWDGGFARQVQERTAAHERLVEAARALQARDPVRGALLADVAERVRTRIGR